MAAEIKTITSDAVIVHPEVFTFASPTVVSKSSAAKTQLTFDVKLKHTCNHKLLSGTYKLTTCPRCLGTGYYYDIKFNDVGKISEVLLEDKLIQALEKLMQTLENKYHPEIAAGIQKWLGVLGNRDNLGVIQDNIIATLASLKEIQKSVYNLSPRARISTINNIVTDLTSPTILRYTITLTTVSGEEKTLVGTTSLDSLTT